MGIPLTVSSHKDVPPVSTLYILNVKFWLPVSGVPVAFVSLPWKLISLGTLETAAKEEMERRRIKIPERTNNLFNIKTPPVIL
jgi:hypothetical protein